MRHTLTAIGTAETWNGRGDVSLPKESRHYLAFVSTGKQGNAGDAPLAGQIIHMPVQRFFRPEVSLDAGTHPPRALGASRVEIAARNEAPRSQPWRGERNFHLGFNHQGIGPPGTGDPGFGAFPPEGVDLCGNNADL